MNQTLFFLHAGAAVNDLAFAPVFAMTSMVAVAIGADPVERLHDGRPIRWRSTISCAMLTSDVECRRFV